MKQLLFLLLFVWICAGQTQEITKGPQKPSPKREVNDWISLTGEVEEIISPSVFFLKHEEGISSIHCNHHDITEDDSITVKGLISSVQYNRIKVHLIYKDNTLIFQRRLGSYDTLSIPSNIEIDAENAYLYKYTKKLKTSAQTTIIIGATLTVSSIAIARMRSKSREREYEKFQSNLYKTNEDPYKNDESLIDSLGTSIEQVGESIGNAFADGLYSAGDAAESAGDVLIFGTLGVSGTILFITGLTKLGKLKKLPAVKSRKSPNIELSLQPGGTIREPGLFLVGTF